MAKNPIIWNKYVGIPYKMLGYDFNGCYCYGLVWLVLLQEYGIQIPKHNEKIKTAIRTGEKVNDELLWIDNFKQIPIHIAEEGDVIRMRSWRDGEILENHVGIYVDSNHILHTEESSGSLIERVDSPTMKWRLLTGYRHDV